MMTMLEKAETAILRAADIMRTHVNDSKGHTKKNLIPFELVTFVSLELRQRKSEEGNQGDRL